DDKVRVVMKEMPIFGEDSMFAAKAALAAKRQNKYWELHVALMQEQRVDKDVTLRVAKGLGIDTDKLQKDMSDPVFDKAIADNLQLAEALGIQGTPGFIIDTKVNVGFMPLDGLKQSIAEVRKDGCKAC
ncbi:MAG: DsbA family protein, partial [Pseudomonadota bacterium]